LFLSKDAAYVKVEFSTKVESGGSEVDLSHFKQSGHEYDAVYDVSRIASDARFRRRKNRGDTLTFSSLFDLLMF